MQFNPIIARAGNSSNAVKFFVHAGGWRERKMQYLACKLLEVYFLESSSASENFHS